jgi:hypothetical protein
MFSDPAMTHQYATDIKRINSITEGPGVRRAYWPSQFPGIIALTFTA